MRSNSCPRCQGTMVEGFTLGERHGMPSLARWVEGLPQKTFWSGIKGIGKPIDIKTYRCRRCGFLENYAPD